MDAYCIVSTLIFTPLTTQFSRTEVVNSHEDRGGFINYVLGKWRDPTERMESIYLNVLSRLPTSKEKIYFQRYLERSLYRNKDLAYEDLYWVLLNSAEFSLNH